MTDAKLPLWRLIAGFGIFGLLFAVLAALAPTYIENYQLSRYVRTLVASPAAASEPDDALRADVVTHAHQLALPVQPQDVQVTHTSGKLKVQARYKVKFNLSLYPVDLHMSAP